MTPLDRSGQDDLIPAWRRDATPSAATGPHGGGRLELRLIGQMQARHANGTVSLPRVRKTRALLAILAMAGARPVLRDHVTALLWSGRAREQARASLRQCVHDLQTLSVGLGLKLLRCERQSLLLDADLVWVDVLALRQASMARPEALDPRRGGFLEDLVGLDPAFDAWIAFQERQLREEAAAVGLRGPEALREPNAATIAPVPDRESGVARPRSERSRSGAWLGVASFRATDPADENSLSVGLAEEITTALARFRWMNLIAPGSIAALAHEATGQSARWRGLDLDFLLDGTIQRGGGRVRVTVRLLDMRSGLGCDSGGEVVWSQRFERDAADLFTLQDEIAAETAAQVDPQMMLRESRRASVLQPRDATAYELMLQAIPAIYRLTQPEYGQAGALLARAAERAPNDATIFGWWACWYAFLVGQGWADNAEAAMQRAGELAERAVTLDPGCARALSIAGYVRSFVLHQDMAETIGLHERALALNPNLAFAWVVSALSLAYAGQHDAAVSRAQQAKRLSPFDPHSFFFDSALMVPKLMLGEFETVVALARRSLALNPAMSATWKGLLSALGHLGRVDEAREVRARLGRLEPGFTLAAAAARSPLRRVQDLHLYLEGLRRAGLAPN